MRLWEIALPPDEIDRTREMVRYYADRFRFGATGELILMTERRQVAMWPPGSYDYVIEVNDDVDTIHL